MWLFNFKLFPYWTQSSIFAIDWFIAFIISWISDGQMKEWMWCPKHFKLTLNWQGAAFNKRSKFNINFETTEFDWQVLKMLPPRNFSKRVEKPCTFSLIVQIIFIFIYLLHDLWACMRWCCESFISDCRASNFLFISFYDEVFMINKLQLIARHNLFAINILIVIVNFNMIFIFYLSHFTSLKIDKICFH